MRLSKILSPLFFLVLASCGQHPAYATTCNVPYTFSNGTASNASTVNSNFTALQTCANNIDYTNIGSAGTYASQIIPLTQPNATFGGTAIYTFPNGVTSDGPTTVNVNPLTANAGLIVTGNSSFDAGHTLSANGPVSINNGVTVTGNSSFDAGHTLSANGVFYPNGGMNVTGNVTFDASHTVTFNGDTYLGGNIKTDIAVPNNTIRANKLMSGVTGTYKYVAGISDNSGNTFAGYHSVIINATSSSSPAACGTFTNYCAAVALNFGQRFTGNYTYSCGPINEQHAGYFGGTNNSYVPQSLDGYTFYLNANYASEAMNTICTGY